MALAIQQVSGEKISGVADVGSLARRLSSEYGAGLAGIEVPQRSSILRENPFAAFDTMPAYSDRHQLFVTKIGAVVPQNDPTLQSVHAVVLAFSARTGRPLAILDGDAITNLKCAAITALVTDLCAPPEAEVLALIGSGVQAREQIRGVGAVRQLRQVRVYSRNRDRVLNFIRDNAEHCAGAEFVACASAEEAVGGADIISTATTSVEPIISAGALEGRPVHINCMGNHSTQSRELPLSVLQQSLLVVEDIDTAVLEAGDVHRGALTIEQLRRQDVTELRRRRTVFSSTGHAFLDLIAVVYLLDELGLNDESGGCFGRVPEVGQAGGAISGP